MGEKVFVPKTKVWIFSLDLSFVVNRAFDKL